MKYATDENGNYVEVQSIGWDAEITVLSQAWDEVNEQAKEALEKVKAGQWSTLAYHSTKCMMNEAMLSEYMDMSKAKVKEHLYNPAAFAALPAATKEKYAEVLNIDLNELLRAE